MPLDRREDGVIIDPAEMSLNTQGRELLHAIRCVRVAPDGSTMASGDWVGNIRIHDLSTEEP